MRDRREELVKCLSGNYPRSLWLPETATKEEWDSSSRNDYHNKNVARLVIAVLILIFFFVFFCATELPARLPGVAGSKFCTLSIVEPRNLSITWRVAETRIELNVSPLSYPLVFLIMLLRQQITSSVD